MRGEPGHAIGQPVGRGGGEFLGAARQVEGGTATPGDRAAEPPAPAAEADLGPGQTSGVVHVVGAAAGPARMLQAEVAAVRTDLERDVHQLAVDPVVAPDGAAGW